MPEIKLKPCPFCGDEAQMMERLRGQTQKVYYVCCMSRKCPVNPYTDELKSFSDAAYWWNKRADTTENIVHCKDCAYCEEAHYEDDGEQPYVKTCCSLLNRTIQSNDFCSYGKIKEN